MSESGPPTVVPTPPCPVEGAARPATTLGLERREDGVLVLRLLGGWDLRAELPSASLVDDAIGRGPTPARIAFDTSGLADWDTALPVFLRAVQVIARRRNVPVDAAGLPEGVRRLLALAEAVPPQETGGAAGPAPGLLARLGRRTLELRETVLQQLTFLGEVTLALWAFLRGRARYRRTDLGLAVEQAGPKALPIISLVSFLVGLILAFVGAVQLGRLGAQTFIADLVGLAMAREMGPMMAAIIMAGRTGAAYAAQIGTMQVRQEVDALKTLGISPVEFLVLPRVLALVMMLPLLTLYADLVGILGGMVVSVSLFDVTLTQYWQSTVASLSLKQFVIGLGKSVFFGALIAMAGCQQGMKVGGSAAAVGEAATAAVVAGIVGVIVVDGLFAMVFSVLRI